MNDGRENEVDGEGKVLWRRQTKKGTDANYGYGENYFKSCK